MRALAAAWLMRLFAWLIPDDANDWEADDDA